MNKYELGLILSGSLNEESFNTTLKKYTDMIEQDGGKIVSLNKVGLKKFAYPINYKKEGHYVYVEFESLSTLLNRLQGLFNIDEAVVRHLFIRK